MEEHLLPKYQLNHTSFSKGPLINYTTTITDITKPIQRSHSSPSIFTESTTTTHSEEVGVSKNEYENSTSVVTQAIMGVILYVSLGILVFMLTKKEFKGHRTITVVDALYFVTVTLCTVGYGDIVPSTNFTKIFTCLFILVGFGFVYIMLNGLVTCVLDKQEEVLRSTMDEKRLNIIFSTCIMDVKKRRVRIRIKVALALGVVGVSIAIGSVMAHFLEGLNWIDSLFLSITSVTTVGYGDYAFSTMEGRLFASIWLLISTLSVARAFLFLTELRIEKRNRKFANWVITRKITLKDLMSADLDKDGSVSVSEFVIYKLKEMGKISERDVEDIIDQFSTIDGAKCGKVRLADLVNWNEKS